MPQTFSSVEEYMKYLAASSGSSIPQIPGAVSTSSTASPMFALIIGIGKYPSAKTGWPRLYGTIADAELMHSFLLDTLQVPKENITTLFEEKATRVAIENAIAQLIDDPRINYGDPILIYYAGHGTQTVPPPGWPSGGNDTKIQMLVPYDAIYKEQDDAAGRFQGVLDIVLGNLLSQIADKKGDNITVILDCCFSGSGTRGEADGDIVRGFDFPEGYEVEPPEISGGDRGMDVSQGFLQYGVRSHVVISAARHDEEANETPQKNPPPYYRGRFTTAVVDLMQKEGVNTLTYRDLVERIPVLKDTQNPQCEGANRDRILFNGKSTGRQNRYQVVYNKNDDSFTLQVGEANGIRPGAIFTIYSDAKLSQELGSLEVESTQAFTSTLRRRRNDLNPQFTLGVDPGWAIKAKVGQPPDVLISLPFDDRLRPVWDMIYGAMSGTRLGDVIIEYVLPGDEQKADVILSLTPDNMAQFSIISLGTGPSAHILLPYKIELDDPDRIYSILYGIAHFCFHLRRTSSSHELRSKQTISLECNRVVDTDPPLSASEFDLAKRYFKAPVGPNLVLNNSFMLLYHKDGDEVINYGFRLTNKSDANLYINIFYFDMDTLAISQVYSSATAKLSDKAEESLPRSQSGAPGYLTLGYGSSGTSPWTFSVTKGRNVSYGILKIFLSTKSINLSDIKQDSPFGDNGRGPDAEPVRPEPMWDTLEYIIRIEETAPKKG